MQEYSGANILRKEIAEKLVLLNRIERATRNVGVENPPVEELTKEEMLALLNATAGDEEFYESEFEIYWCGFKCKLFYGAENHNNLTDTIEGAIEDEC